MKIVRVGNGREYETPTTWAEGERLIINSMRYHEGRGGNTNQRAVAGRVAYGLFGERMMAADPTQALMYLMLRICQRKGAGLEK